jgi:nucleoid-associated protein YgaU
MEEYFKFFQAKDADSLRLIEESFNHFEKTNNKDIIKNADVVPVGTTIKIPELSPKADKK